MLGLYHFLDQKYKDLEAWVKWRGDILDAHMNGFVGVLWRTVYSYSQKGVWEAAAMSYYALVSLFPLLMLLVVVIGRILGPASAGTQLQDFLAIFLPGSTATELSRTVERFTQEGGLGGTIAIVVLMWSGSGLFSALSGSLDRIFRVTKGLAFWKRRIFGLVIILMLGILMIANIITSLIFSFFDILFLNQTNVWVQIAGLFVPFGFSMGIFATMYRFIPRQRASWDAVWTASLVSALAWELAKPAFGWYIDNVATNMSVIYGSLFTVIVFMLWAYYTWSIVILGAELCVNLSDWFEMRRAAVFEQQQIFAGDYYLRELNPSPIVPRIPPDVS